MTTHIECINMIKQQLRTGDVHNQFILDLYDEIPRHKFVPKHFRHFAYSDMQINLAHHQRMMTPLEEALILQSLELTGQEIILEVGTGTGFLTALLSRLSQKVISVDYFAEFSVQARQVLAAHRCDNVELVTGNAARGWLDKAPYDVIVYTGSMEELTELQRLQILPGGKLFVIIGKKPIMQGQLHTLDHDGLWHKKLIFETNLPPLIDPLKTKEFVF